MKRKEPPLHCAECKNMIVGRYYEPVCYHIKNYEGWAYAIKLTRKACKLFEQKAKNKVS